VRILFVNENIGGHATVHHHLAVALRDRGDVEAEFVTVPAPGRVRRLAGAPVPGLARLDLDLQPLRAQLALSAWVRRRIGGADDGGRFDAVHVYTHNAGMLSVGLLGRVPSVVTLDTTNAHNAYRLPYRMPTRFTPLTVRATRPFEQRVYRAATRVVANSEWAATSLRHDYGMGDDKLRVFPLGIGAPAFGDAVAPGVHRTGLPTVVFVGRQVKRKGGELLRQVHQAALADRCRLVLVTTEPVAPGRNVEVVADLRQGDERLWDILRDAAVFAFPSTIDQAPNVVLEAMAAGLPVVAVDTGAVGEMVRDGVTGLLIGGDDAAGLERALTRLLDRPDERVAMAAAGRLRFDERYRAAASTDRLLGVLAEAIAARPTPARTGARS
jgi:alpha-maltose-1-phosphate synthase